MDTPTFNSMIKNLRGEIEGLAKLTVRKYRRKAARDGKKMLTAMKTDLRRWSNLLEEDRLTTEDFEFLVLAQKDAIKMSALERSGLAKIRSDHFKFSVFNLIIDTVFDTVIPAIPD